MVERDVRDRIKELRRVKASELVSNPKNWRRHPKEQSAAMRGLLNEIGYAGALLARELPDGKLQLIDGHLRLETTPKATVPVLVLDVTEAEADKILLTFDPISAMAQADRVQLEALLSTVRTEDKAIAAMLERVAGESAWQVAEQREIRSTCQRTSTTLPNYRRSGAQRPDKPGKSGLIDWSAGIAAMRAPWGRLWADGGPKSRMIWTDPPYGVDYAAKNAYLNRADRGNRIQVPIENDKLTAGETGFLFGAALSVAKGSHSGASVYATVPSGPLLVHFIQALTAAGFTFRAQLTWVKQQFVIGMADYHHRYQPILYGWLPARRTISQ